MSIQQAYNTWSATYDTVENKTRDLEAIALRAVLTGSGFENILEIGCGTGKNSGWLADKATNITAVDFSELMLAKAKQKVSNRNLNFVQADVTVDWNFPEQSFDLVTCSLILEHIENLHHIFHQAATALKPDGQFYICELHPFKQYQGSKARFENGDGVFELECFVHHLSDYLSAANRNNFICMDIQEWFDDDDKKGTPRLVSFLFKRKL